MVVSFFVSVGVVAAGKAKAADPVGCGSVGVDDVCWFRRSRNSAGPLDDTRCGS
jgi:hypothetical protein